MRNIITTISLLMFSLFTMAESVNIVTPKGAGNRVTYAAEYLQKKLRQQGFTVVVTANGKEDKKAEHRITLGMVADAKAELAAREKQMKKDRRKGYPVEQIDSFITKKEGFTITSVTLGSKQRGLKARITVVGNDGTGCIYGCGELAEQIKKHGITDLPGQIKDAPEWCSAADVSVCRSLISCPDAWSMSILTLRSSSLGSTTSSIGLTILTCLSRTA